MWLTTNNIIRLNYTLPNLEINTEDVLNTITNMKTNKRLGPVDIYPKILKENRKLYS